MYVYDSPTKFGVFRTYIDDNYKFTETRDTEHFSYYNPPEITTAHYANEIEVFVIGKNLQNGA